VADAVPDATPLPVVRADRDPLELLVLVFELHKVPERAPVALAVADDVVVTDLTDEAVKDAVVVGVSEGLAPMERDGVGDCNLQSGPLIGPLMPLSAENPVTLT
jgi:hypothetical protein